MGMLVCTGAHAHVSRLSRTVHLIHQDFECLLGTNTDRYTFTSSNCLMLQILSGLTIGVGLVIGIIQCYTWYVSLCRRGLGG